MEPKDVRKRVEQIRKLAVPGADFEALHGLEDDLYEDVLKAIAMGVYAPQAIAGEALRTKKIEFPRYAA
jgi:hypothetical protein